MPALPIKEKAIDFSVLYRRLGYPSNNRLLQACKKSSINIRIEDITNFYCRSCYLGKADAISVDAMAGGCHAAQDGFIVRTCAPYTPAQHGRAERAGRTLIDAARSICIETGLPEKLARDVRFHDPANPNLDKHRLYTSDNGIFSSNPGPHT
ncbi:hypothetical protein L249_0907 [Ophiocordyceps polyrhachis-furcata BCC 54312]|uniref:Integrase catalytic domain-containing protein n=1 Tax=Ophiocordyceps polyrhachis-furcata BCC 54312 TaxID=1330021 RepID=A0A367LCP0_9HYPO|nr:hypothetical protein L249_0907 [Ophiocordyceps polyrhachis-furcata BCC 54312]